MMNSNFKEYLLEITKTTDCEEVEIIQSLWSGYGKISRYRLTGSIHNTVIVKFISPKNANAHPRGWNTNQSHNRKVKSYEVETSWYENWNSICSNYCRTPEFLGSFSNDKDQWIILEDLSLDFPIVKNFANLSEVKTCLKWLANFHAVFINKAPKDLWEIGTYWHLDTRPDEFEKIKNKKLKEKAHSIDRLLNESQYQTIVHGDAKLANFCFSSTGKKVAAVDFQYVGRGCGIKDVMYLIGSCLSSQDCELHEKELLDFYFIELETALNISSINIDFKELETEWRQMYPIASADFTRFLLGWMPDHQKINQYSLKLLNSVLANL